MQHVYELGDDVEGSELFVTVRPIFQRLLCKYRVGQTKVNPECSTHNFVKYWPIFTILSLLQSPENLHVYAKFDDDRL